MFSNFISLTDYFIAFCATVMLAIFAVLFIMALRSKSIDLVEQDLAQFEARYNYCMSTEHFTPNECAIFAGSDR